MSNEENGKTREITLAELQTMSEEERNEAFMKAIKIEGTALVRDKDGNPKYDHPERAGQYGEENIGDLA